MGKEETELEIFVLYCVKLYNQNCTLSCGNTTACFDCVITKLHSSWLRTMNIEMIFQNFTAQLL